MDKKQLFTGISLAMTVVGLWYMFVFYMEKTHPELMHPPVAATQPEISPAPAAASGETPPASQPASMPPAAPTTLPALRAIGGDAGTLDRWIGSDDKKSQYAMKVNFAASGAAIKSVILNDFQSSDNTKLPYTFEEPYPGHPESSPLATRSVIINGMKIDIGDVVWNVKGVDSASATFALPFQDASGKLVATLSKSYRLTQRSEQERGYELKITYGIENDSGAPLTVQTVYNGTNTPPKETDRGPDRAVIAGYVIGPKEIEVVQHAIEEFKPSAPSMDLTKSKEGKPAVWAGSASVYFDAVLQPTDSAVGATPAYTIKAEALDPEHEDRHILLTVDTGEVTVAPGKSVDLPASAFLAPKTRDLLDSAYYAAFPRHYDETLVVRSSMCGIPFCSFPWLVTALVKMLWFFHLIALGDWGIAIILLVVVVRACLHPITKKSQVNMMRMQKMGPEVERLKKKYGDDKDGLNKAMMGFYKEQGFAPVLGCLPMFLQMPIWIALWGALQSTFELRQAPFLEFRGVSLTWIHDLAKPDALFSWAPVTLPFGIVVSSLNVLPIFMGVVFYLQQKFTPKPPATTPEQEQQQKMMQWMSLLFPVFLYKGPSGLNLYILTSTTMGIFENKIIRNHIKQREEAEKAGRVFISAKPTRAKRQNKDDGNDKNDKKERTGIVGRIIGWFARWVSDIQERAEQVRRDANRNKM